MTMLIGPSGPASASFYSEMQVPNAAQQANSLTALKNDVGQLKSLSVKDYTTAAGQASNPSLWDSLWGAPSAKDQIASAKTKIAQEQGIEND